MRSLGGGGPPADRGIETTLRRPQVQPFQTRIDFNNSTAILDKGT